MCQGQVRRQPHATACHSIAVYKLRLPYASQRRHNEMRRIAKRDCKPRHAKASLCTGQRHHTLCGEGNHLRRRASDSLCRSCAYLMQAGPRHNEMCHDARAATCYSEPQHRRVQAKGTINGVPGCKGNHTRQRTTAPLWAGCACLVQTTLGTTNVCCCKGYRMLQQASAW